MAASSLTRYPEGLLFPEDLMRAVRERFLQVEHDHRGRERLYFDNAGGSLRLKAAMERMGQVDAVPDPTWMRQAMIRVPFLVIEAEPVEFV